ARIRVAVGLGEVVDQGRGRDRVGGHREVRLGDVERAGEVADRVVGRGLPARGDRVAADVAAGVGGGRVGGRAAQVGGVVAAVAADVLPVEARIRVAVGLGEVVDQGRGRDRVGGHREVRLGDVERAGEVADRVVGRGLPARGDRVAADVAAGVGGG